MYICDIGKSRGVLISGVSFKRDSTVYSSSTFNTNKSRGQLMRLYLLSRGYQVVDVW